ncbi:hypothetical protein ACWEQU_05780 [Streptomyces nodosus]
MAAVTLDTVELETLVEACLTGHVEFGVQFLNLFKTKNVTGTLPNSSGLVRPEDTKIRAALAGVQGDLA